MAKKVKAIASEVRIASVFAADGLTAQQAIADAVAHGVHNGRYALLAEAIQFGARRATNSKSALYAVWTTLVEHHYSDNGVYDDESCGRALCAALKVAGLRGDTPDATAAKCRAWLAGEVKAETARRKAEKERLAAEKEAAEALRKATIEAAEELRLAEEAEAALIAARHAASVETTCTVVPEVAQATPALPAPQAEPAKPKRGAVKKDSAKAATPRTPRKPRKAA